MRKNRYIMKRLLFIITFCTVYFLSYGQKKVYTTTEMEMVFSWANVRLNGVDANSVLRFTPFFNYQNFVNFDQSESFGLYTGLGFRNVGFIYDIPGTNMRKKARNYYLGIPVGFKFGKLDKTYFYGGYELELPFVYKEKTFVNEEKTDKYTVWFSSRSAIQNTLMVGIQFPYGTNIKFKYYLNNFYKKSYTETDENGNTVQPYAKFDASMFYISLNFKLFRNVDFYYTNL